MLLIDKYAYFNKLKDVHPVEKVLLSFYLLLFALVVKDSLVSLVTFIVMSAFIVLAAKIPFSYYVKLLLLPSFFLFSGIVTILISFTDEQTVIHPIWSAHLGEWQVYVSKENLKRAVNLFFVVLGSVSCLYFLTLTTPLTAILGVLRKLKVPSLLLELISLTYRFIFVFLEASIEIYQAQASRLGYITIRKGIQSLGLLISTLFSKMFQRTQQLSIAMNSRGYGEDISLLNESYRYSPVNWFIMIGIFTGMAILYVKFGGSL
jgi:cobalt/nickel transport system permease protein